MTPLIHTPPRSLLRGRRGYVMLLAMLFIAILSVVGASSLQVSGVDQRIALQNRKHMLVVNTADAGTEHARNELVYRDPTDEGFDTAGSSSTDTSDVVSVDSGGDFVTATEAEADFGGLAYTHNLGVYWVDATYHRCGNPPPGYSTEIGQAKFRSDYWEMESQARMQDTSYTNVNETQATTSAMIRKVKFGTCKVRLGMSG